MKIFNTMLVVSLLAVFNIYGQERLIDENIVDKWPTIKYITGANKSCIISNDGKHVVYQVSIGSNKRKIVVQDIGGLIKKEYSNISPSASPIVTSDSKHFVALTLDSQLLIQNLHDGKTRYLKSVIFFLTPQRGNGQWILYKTSNGEFNLENLIEQKKQIYLGVLGAQFSTDGNVLIAQKKTGLMWIDLKTGKEIGISNSNGCVSFCFSNSESKIGFLTNQEGKNSLKYFDALTGKTEMLFDDGNIGIEQSYSLSERLPMFTRDDSKVIFYLNKQKSPIAEKGVVSTSVNVWSYKDLVLQPKQLSKLPEELSKTYAAVVDLKSKKTIQIESDSLILLPGSFLNKQPKNFAILYKPFNNNEYYWNREILDFWLVSLDDGTKTRIMKGGWPTNDRMELSPDEKNVIWFDGGTHHFSCFNTSSKNVSIITRDAKDDFSVFNWIEYGEKGKRYHNPVGNPIWVNEETVLIQSRYDIWKFDLTSKKKPINITNGFGKKSKIRLRLIKVNESLIQIHNGDLILSGFNESNKKNGFFKVSLASHKDPEKLTMEDAVYYFSPISAANHGNISTPESFAPVKALNADVFVCRKMTAEQSPNLYSTKDFKSFKQISTIFPERTDYNLPKTELITWKLRNGTTCNGVLHIPKHLDRSKKYPIIFTYYERHSDYLNVFRYPDILTCPINIPWYVSRDYLVFEIDFYPQTGKVAESTVKNIKAAVQELSKIPYVDTTRMGLQGHSHGGYLTNVIASGCDLFKAACEMAGYSNTITEYGSIRPEGFNNQIAEDLQQRNIGAFPWDQPQAFIENSPVFNIGKMTTPLLIVHNFDDTAVSFSHAIEMYLGLRRIKKKVWLLQYDGEGHNIMNRDNRLDYTIRMQQFFDHYLKDKPAPLWMVEGIPAKYKGIKSGLQLDSLNRTP